MPSFKYSARDREGRTVTGIVSGKSQADAVADLRKRNLIVLDVRQTAAQTGTKKSAGGGGLLASLSGSRPSATKEQIVIFTRQLATMISAGVPLLESLEVLQEQADTPGFRIVLDGVIESVRGGTDLSTALDRYARVFPNIYISMVRMVAAYGSDAVAGGTGLAAVYQIARDFGEAEVFAGARTAGRLYFLEECRRIAEVHVATDDGSDGYHGLVTELLREHLQAMTTAEREQLVFYNCGPEPMVHAAIAVEREFCGEGRIFSAIDYLTKCGVGICGACAAPDGRWLCVDGPFLQAGAD